MTSLVIFDFDGVLADTEVVACRIMAEVLTAEGFAVQEQEMRAFVGMSGPEAFAIIAERFGRAVPDAARAAIRAGFRAHLQDGLLPMPGVVEVIDALAVPSCVASNSSHAYLALALQTAGLLSRFEGRVFSSADVARPKPQPDLFLHAADRMGVAPAECLVVEDSIHGVSAGVAAGMRVIGFVGGGHCDAEHATVLSRAGARVVCGDMAELAHALAREGALERAPA